MMKLQNTFTHVVLILLLAGLILSTHGIVYAQDPLPPSDLEQSWTPPVNDGSSYIAPGVNSKFDASSSPVQPSTGYSKSQSSSYYPYPPYPPDVPVIMSTAFVDERGRVQTQIENEAFYLSVQINTPGFFYIAEYFPPNSGTPPHWLMYGYNLDRAGTWTLGPFYPDAYEPKGQHTWRMWLYASGSWAQRLARFNYQPSIIPFPSPSIDPIRADSWSTLQIMVVMVLVGGLGVTIGMLISNKKRFSN